MGGISFFVFMVSLLVLTISVVGCCIPGLTQPLIAIGCIALTGMVLCFFSIPDRVADFFEKKRWEKITQRWAEEEKKRKKEQKILRKKEEIGRLKNLLIKYQYGTSECVPTSMFIELGENEVQKIISEVFRWIEKIQEEVEKYVKNGGSTKGAFQFAIRDGMDRTLAKKFQTAVCYFLDGKEINWFKLFFLKGGEKDG
jgi:hypothetical protein